MEDIKNKEDVKIFVDAFYAKIREDGLLAPIFAKRIANDNWQKHLNRMYTFWNAVLLFEREYKGNPFSKHVGLQAQPIHFERWISLFKQTIDQHFVGEKANEVKLRADKMGEIFSLKLEYLRNNPNYKSIV